MALEKNILSSVCYILMLFGIALFILGVILADRAQPLAILLDVGLPPYFIVGILAISLGVMAFLQTFIGIYGNITGRRNFLYMFMIMVVISAVVQVATIYFAVTYSSTLKYTTEMGLLQAMYQYPPLNINRTETDLVRTWDFTQQHDHCCGVVSPTDWSNFSYFQPDTYPDSCCRNMTSQCGLSTVAAGEDVYNQGCLDVLVSNTFMALVLTIVASVAMYLPELLGILSANHVMKTIKRKQRFMRIN